MVNCIFCSMVQGKVDFIKVYEDKSTIALMDIFPATKGQALIIPKFHKEYIFDLTDKEYKNLFLTVKLVAKGIDKAFKPLRTCIVVEGFQVPHVHIRLHPAYETRLNLQPQSNPEKKNLEQQAEEIRRFL